MSKLSVPIPGFSGYSVDDDGVIWSPGSWRGWGRRAMRPVADKDGYLKVRLTAPGKKRRKLSVHVLVCIAFHGPRPPGMVVRHIDGRKANNRPGNLAWGTSQDNVDDRSRHRTAAMGERHGRSKLTERQAVEIRRRREGGESTKSLGAEFMVSPMQVRNIANRTSWSHV